MKKYWIPTGPWPIGTGYEHAHRLLVLFGMSEGNQEDYDVLVLPGGADIGARPERDKIEFAALETAQKCGKKIFGICRGMQVMLYVTGVEIIDHLPDYGGLLEHTTLTGHWTGQSGWHSTEQGLLVNSRHHQGAIKNLGHWEVVDRSIDGVVEAVKCKNQFGVQWHPEHPEMRDTPALEWLRGQLSENNII
jgi:putative glutamine amidotransferase